MTSADVRFKAISNFATALAELFEDVYRPLKLYCFLINKTKPDHKIAIQKHIDAFQEFCTVNKESILSKNVDGIVTDKIVYSERVFIDIKEILKISDTETRDVIWKHILTIYALIDPSGNAKKALKEKPKTGPAESNFLSSLMSSVEEHIDPNSTNPMDAVGSIMKSGVFTDLIQNMTEGFSNGSLDMGKLMGEVGNMVGKMSSDAGDSEGGKEAVDILQKMMGGMTSSNQEHHNLSGMTEGNSAGPDLGGMMSGLMGMMTGSGGVPDLGGMLSGAGNTTIDDKINAQLNNAKKKGNFPNNK